MEIERSLGLFSDRSVLRTARLAYEDGKVVIQKLREISAEISGTGLPPLVVATEGLREDFLITSLASRDVLIKPLELKLTKKAEIDAVLRFQAEPLLPFPLEHALIDSVTLHREENKTVLAIFATQQATLRSHLEQFHLHQIEPEAVSCPPHALSCFAQEYFPDHSSLFILHIEEASSTLIIMKDRVLAASRSLPVGSDDTDNERFLMELSKAILSLETQTKEKEIITLAIVGNAPQEKGVFSELNKAPIFCDDKLSPYALPIGLALSTLPPYQRSLINFRQGDLRYPHPWKRMKKPVFSYFAACLLLTFALFFFSKEALRTKERGVIRSYGEMLAHWGTDFDTFEQSFSNNVSSPSGLSKEIIHDRLNYIDSTVLAPQELFPLFPNLPLVTDVLAWISTHPTVVTLNENDERVALISLKSLSYTLVKYPKIGKKKEPYHAKVDVSFTAPTTKDAREFHDALLESTDFINLKHEVKWSSNKDVYMATFYLKNKPVRPL